MIFAEAELDIRRLVVGAFLWRQRIGGLRLCCLPGKRDRMRLPYMMW